MSDWRDRARRLHESGMAIRAIARSVGKGATTVRVALDIDGEYARMVARNNANKAKYRAAEKAIRVRIEPQPKGPDRSIQKAYADKPVRPSPSLPKISLPAIEEAPVVRKFAPRVRWTSSPGAERWRQVHLAMIRAGKITPRHDLTSEMQQ